MKLRIYTGKHKLSRPQSFLLFCVNLFLIALFSGACSELEKPKTEPFYAQTAPPQKKEFRWSNGKMPKTFDPARAAAPPETDIIRAVFEGLTDTNPKTLEAIPSVAEKWTASEDFKTWTFYLRKDAKWSNGERVTAADFVSSWKRLAEMGDQVSHQKLLGNIVGSQIVKPAIVPPVENEANANLLKPVASQNLPLLNSNTNSAPKIETKTPPTPEKTSPPTEKSARDKVKEQEKTPPEIKFGVVAVNDLTLKVSLVESDRDFPMLVAHPMFRPIYGDGKDFESGKLNAAVVTNGAFRIASVGPEGITLDRAEHFWGRDRVELERVSFVVKESAEKALEAYRKGEIDAITNVDFEPLALKLLAPFDDFQQTTHSALNFYEFNRDKKPFDDVRVREALAISIEREHLAEVEMEDSAKPALSFLPFGDATDKKFVQDNDRAKELMTEAGFEDGENFPIVRLVINRNNTQQRIAKAVAKMWKQALNIDTEIIIKESSEIDGARQTGDFDVLRRGVVLPTADETVGLMAILEPKKQLPLELTIASPPAAPNSSPVTESSPENSNTESKNTNQPAASNTSPDAAHISETVESAPILTEDEAIAEIPAIPLYFPTSYSLVKPYIQGFEINTLDAPSLKDVKIDNNWQPKKPNGES